MWKAREMKDGKYEGPCDLCEAIEACNTYNFGCGVNFYT